MLSRWCEVKVVLRTESVVGPSKGTAALSESAPCVRSVLFELSVQFFKKLVEFARDAIEWSVTTLIATPAASEKDGVSIVNKKGLLPRFTSPCLCKIP